MKKSKPLLVILAVIIVFCIETLSDSTAQPMATGTGHKTVQHFIMESGKPTGDEIGNFSKPGIYKLRTNYFISRETGDVWYFGSDKKELYLVNKSHNYYKDEKGIKGGGLFPIYRYSVFAMDEPMNPAADKSEKGITARDWHRGGGAYLEGDPFNAFLYGAKNYKQANMCYARAIRLYPDYADAYFSRGFVHEKIGDYQKAIKDFIKAGELNLHYAAAYTTLWWSKYNWRKEHKKLKKYYKKIIKENKEKPDAYISRALLYLKLKDYKKALKDNNRAIKLDQKNTKYYHYRVLTYSQIPDYKELIKDLNTIIELDPNDAKAHKKRIFFYDKMIEKRK